jgi:hypothetical protein
MTAQKADRLHMTGKNRHFPKLNESVHKKIEVFSGCLPLVYKMI